MSFGETVEAKSTLAITGAMAIGGIIALANSSVDTIWGLLKMVIGLALIATAIFLTRAYLKEV